MKTMFGFFVLKERNFPPYTADLLALIGLLFYLVQSVIFAHTTASNLDEGAYLLKGILFATGEYRPFDPGISTNKAPLAFLIPGYVQLLFGAGLRSGRYLAVFFGTMAVLGTWVAARRIGGKWLSAGAVWVFALSPAVIKIYSGGSTQSTIACLMAWSLAFALGERRPLWQLILSGFFAGLMMLVRQNMLPVLPALALYAFWQHGWRAISLLLSGLLIVTVVHIEYWPSILQLWYWVPLLKLPASTTYDGGGETLWRPSINLATRLLSLFQAVRFHFFALVGSTVSVFLWPKLNKWKSPTEFRMAVFLNVLFWGLLYMHATASIGLEYCVYCFTPYISFFNVVGILLLVVSIKSWNTNPSFPLQGLLIIIFLVLLTGMGFSAFEDIGKYLLNLPAPRMRDLRILTGFVTWGEILSNKFQLDHNVAMRYASTSAGLVAAIFLLVGCYLAWMRVQRNFQLNFTFFFISITFVLMFMFSPILHGSAGKKDCTSDVILANEQIGEYLKNIIPPDNLVYWNGGLSMAPFLYLPDVNIFPPQINNGYSFVSKGNSAELFKFGYWNEEMNTEWRATADFFIIEDRRYNSGWKEFLSPEKFDEFPRSPLGTSCFEGSTLRIFRRK